MNADTVTSLAMQALTITLEVSMPFLLTGLAVGLVVSVLQAVMNLSGIDVDAFHHGSVRLNGSPSK